MKKMELVSSYEQVASDSAVMSFSVVLLEQLTKSLVNFDTKSVTTGRAQEVCLCHTNGTRSTQLAPGTSYTVFEKSYVIQ